MKTHVKIALDALEAKLDSEVTTGLWFLALESGKWKIKRNVTKGRKRSFQRLPAKLYKEIQTNKEELEKFILRLNKIDPKERAAYEKFKVDSAFISSKLLEDYHKKLKAEIPTENAANYTYRYAREHFLAFFLKHDPNPTVWYRKLQPAWADYLVGTEFSISVLKKIINSSNRLMRYLHNQRPDEIPLMEFRPLSRAVLAKIRAKKELLGEGKEKRKYIPEKDYKTLLAHIPDDLRSIFEMSYRYGLRRNEVIALYQSPQKIRKGYLLIDEQFCSLNGGTMVRKPPKFNKTRKVNHWNASPNECFELINSLVSMPPDRASRNFTNLTTDLVDRDLIEHSYVLHDCRHTFISNAVKFYDINTVSRSAGHSDISVTNGYLKDTRDLDDEVFSPAS